MLRAMSFGLFIILLLINSISTDWCSYGGSHSSYYCYPGQTCGSYYGDCRGLPTYLLVTIISTCIVFLSICVRCCIHLNSNNIQSTPSTGPHTRQVRVQVHSSANNLGTRSANVVVPIHNIREEAPPSYATAISSTKEQIKY